MSYGNAAALYRLCWRRSDDPDTILRRVVPDTPERLTRYLAFLIRENRLLVAAPVAARIIPFAGADYRPLLLSYCDRLIASGAIDTALETWNAMAAHSVLPYAVLEPDRGVSLTNGDFLLPPLSLGFDWRILSSTGIAVSRSESPSALKVSFSGRQPERCNLLYQHVPLMPDSEYRLQYSCQTFDVLPHSGLRWRIFDASTGSDLAPHSESLSRETFGADTLTFRTGAQTRLVRLTLHYERARGTARLEGWVLLRDVTLTLAEE